ncbi:MAG: dinitrogenase iron-molybdenum cofactor biosynthesis protein [Chloroflexi bacterium]|nr:dinitrogenase iron-molybdenum cofactor biosynthesis protein [Chloroflexota bacterium]
MKIAAITDDGQTISQHFGRAPYYIVVTIENNQIVAREKRNKLGHAQFGGETHADQNDPRGHGFDATAQDRHTRMAEAIADCQALLCGGMGAGAYESMRARGIKPVVTDISLIDEAVNAYVDGKIVDLVDKLH